MDELWRIVSSSVGRSAVIGFLKEARSQGILPLYGTQSLADILRFTDTKFRGLFSRVAGFYVKDPEEEAALLDMIGLEDTTDRREFIRDSKHRRPGENGPDDPGHPGMGLYRDVRGQHTAIQRGEFAPDYLLWLSTNRKDRAAREGTEPPQLRSSVNIPALATSERTQP